MKQEIQFTAAFDKTSTDPAKDCGIHGVNIRFIYGDENGYTQFLLFTNWQLPHVTERLKSRSYPIIGGDSHWMERPLPADLGYHSPKPIYEGQEKTSTCDLIEGGCYYDGSSLNAERIYNVLLSEGSDGVWRELKEFHKELFL